MDLPGTHIVRLCSSCASAGWDSENVPGGLTHLVECGAVLGSIVQAMLSIAGFLLDERTLTVIPLLHKSFIADN